MFLTVESCIWLNSSIFASQLNVYSFVKKLDNSTRNQDKNTK